MEETKSFRKSNDTLLKMSLAKGSSVNIYEKCDKEYFKLISCFI